MVSPCMLMFLAVACGVSAWGEDLYFPPQTRNLNTVLQNVITGPEGDSTITVTGNVEFKETIKVTKKKRNETDHEKMENFFFERCCDMPSNLTHSYNETVRECIYELQEGVSEKACDNGCTHYKGDSNAAVYVYDIIIPLENFYKFYNKEEARSNVFIYNCILQCVGYKLGLNERNGSILPEETISFFLSDSWTVVLGITEDMINTCIRDAKYNTPEIHNPNQGGKVCDTSNTEVVRFTKCVAELENLQCPAKYLRQSKSCHRKREMMKKKLRHRADEKIHNY